MGLLFGHPNKPFDSTQGHEQRRMVNLFVRPGEGPIGHKAKLCDPSCHSDFKLEELQENIDRINRINRINRIIISPPACRFHFLIAGTAENPGELCVPQAIVESEGRLLIH